jgi:hypothetical protein
VRSARSRAVEKDSKLPTRAPGPRTNKEIYRLLGDEVGIQPNLPLSTTSVLTTSKERRCSTDIDQCRGEVFQLVHTDREVGADRRQQRHVIRPGG